MLKKLLLVVIAALLVKKYRDDEDVYNRQMKEYSDAKNQFEEELIESQEAKEQTIVSVVPDVSLTFLMRIGNLVGKTCSCELEITFHNKSNNSYIVRNIAPQLYLFGSGVQWQPVSKTAFQIPAQSSRTIVLGSTNRCVLFNNENAISEFRDRLAEAAGKKRITSVAKQNFSNIVTADWQYEFALYGEKMQTLTWPKFSNTGVKGVLRYCGEAYYPGEHNTIE